MWPK
jgi:hypothetical protein